MFFFLLICLLLYSMQRYLDVQRLSSLMSKLFVTSNYKKDSSLSMLMYHSDKMWHSFISGLTSCLYGFTSSADYLSARRTQAKPKHSTQQEMYLSQGAEEDNFLPS